VYSQNAGHYSAIRKAAAAKKKSFIVRPAIDSDDMENVAAAYEEAAEALAPYRVEMLTAEMKPRQRAQVMESFASGDTDVLIATSVIEVGIDVPDAVIMWVKGSERFGLSQLHQLRGRIGRGVWDSACFFQTDSSSPQAAKRLLRCKKRRTALRIARRGPGAAGTPESCRPAAERAGGSTSCRMRWITKRSSLRPKASTIAAARRKKDKKKRKLPSVFEEKPRGAALRHRAN
jgi:superfamily II DNA or RNA helicase